MTMQVDAAQGIPLPGKEHAHVRVASRVLSETVYQRE